MRNIHIPNSYNVWCIDLMHSQIKAKAKEIYDSNNPEKLLNRSYLSMYIEWWLHNIGYYLTKPFCGVDVVQKTNLRFKDVDLEEWQCKFKRSKS